MTDTLRYYALKELNALPLAELKALWELVPTDRQRIYRQAYEREVKTAGAEGSDAKERRVAIELVRRYSTAALVPIGTRWARAPGRVQAAARNGEPLDSAAHQAITAKQRGSPKIIVPLGLAALVMVAVLFMRGGAGSANDGIDHW